MELDNNAHVSVSFISGSRCWKINSCLKKLNAVTQECLSVTLEKDESGMEDCWL